MPKAETPPLLTSIARHSRRKAAIAVYFTVLVPLLGPVQIHYGRHIAIPVRTTLLVSPLLSAKRHYAAGNVDVGSRGTKCAHRHHSHKSRPQRRPPSSGRAVCVALPHAVHVPLLGSVCKNNGRHGAIAVQLAMLIPFFCKSIHYCRQIAITMPLAVLIPRKIIVITVSKFNCRQIPVPVLYTMMVPFP